jgi:hypothetical protein
MNTMKRNPVYLDSEITDWGGKVEPGLINCSKVKRGYRVPDTKMIIYGISLYGTK